MRFCSAVISVIFTITLFFSINAYAISDNALWEDSAMHILFSDGNSNCSLNYAVAKVKYDYTSNRIHILYMMSFDSFTAEENTGLDVEFNDLGVIYIYGDKTVDYDDSVYFAQVDDIKSDSRTATVYIETTFGIKKGIPSTLAMTTTIYDTEGISSNEFTVDISDGSEEDADITTQKTSKTKTTKTKTTKTKKSRTTKVKTTKSKKSTSAKTDSQDGDITVSSYATVNSEQLDSRISNSSDKKKIIVFIAMGIAGCAAIAGCIVGIKKSNNR